MLLPKTNQNRSMITPNSFNQIEEKAFELTEKFQIKSAPVPVREIALGLGIDIIEYNLGDGASGVLLIDNDRATIGINPNDPPVRQRFTISHEIGHFIYHRTSSQLFVDKDFFIKKYRNPNNSYTQEEFKQEQQANNFAAALLMPRWLLEIEINSIDIDDYTELELIEFLAKRFQVSVSAMSYRMANLNAYI